MKQRKEKRKEKRKELKEKRRERRLTCERRLIGPRKRSKETKEGNDENNEGR
jgi:hypothetical protein